MKTNFNFFFCAIALAGSILGLNIGREGLTTPALFQTQHQGQGSVPQQLAQTLPEDYAPSGCRVARDRVGIYAEPSTLAESRGFLEQDDVVLLGSGSGPGWARIVAPETGWIQSKFLRGSTNTVCPPDLRQAIEEDEVRGVPDNQPNRNRTPEGLPKPVTPPIQPQAPKLPIQRSVNVQVPASVPAPGQGRVTRVARAICEVLPEEGLVVRDMPNTTSSRMIGNIQAGRYTFQFSNRRVERETSEGLREWIYITAPAKGWISSGFVNGGSNLQGEGCS